MFLTVEESHDRLRNNYIHGLISEFYFDVARACIDAGVEVGQVCETVFVAGTPVKTYKEALRAIHVARHGGLAPDTP